MSFESLGLRAELLRAVQEHGCSVPTAVQAFAIPLILAGRDVWASAQTGSGKTAGFALPVLQLLLPGADESTPDNSAPATAMAAVHAGEDDQRIDESPAQVDAVLSGELFQPAVAFAVDEALTSDVLPDTASSADAAAPVGDPEPPPYPMFGARPSQPGSASGAAQPVPPVFPSFGRARPDVKARAEAAIVEHAQRHDTPEPVSAGRSDVANQVSAGASSVGGQAPPPRALVLVPTRELCAQVTESVRAYGKYLPLRCVQIFGGVGMQPQVVALKAGVDIIVATPGRLLDHIQRGSVDLSALKVLVLDEADRMLDMGFIDVIRKVIGVLPASRQNLIFSASPSSSVVALADELLVQPEVLKLAAKTRPIDAVEQHFYDVEPPHKADALAFLFHERGWPQALIFTRTKHGADRLAKKLYRAGITSDSIHGNKGQGARTRALTRFKAAEIAALVATDVAARGIDIEGLPLVVNFDLPHVPEDFIQRIARTGTDELSGQAISLVSQEEQQQLRAIEELVGAEYRVEPLEGFLPRVVQPREPRPEQAAQPVREVVQQLDASGEEFEGAEFEADEEAAVVVGQAAPAGEARDAGPLDAGPFDAGNDERDGRGRRSRRRRRGRGRTDDEPRAPVNLLPGGGILDAFSDADDDERQPDFDGPNFRPRSAQDRDFEDDDDDAQPAWLSQQAAAFDPVDDDDFVDDDDEDNIGNRIIDPPQDFKARSPFPGPERGRNRSQRPGQAGPMGRSNAPAAAGPRHFSPRDGAAGQRGPGYAGQSAGAAGGRRQQTQRPRPGGQGGQGGQGQGGGQHQARTDRGQGEARPPSQGGRDAPGFGTGPRDGSGGGPASGPGNAAGDAPRQNTARSEGGRSEGQRSRSRRNRRGGQRGDGQAVQSSGAGPTAGAEGANGNTQSRGPDGEARASRPRGDGAPRRGRGGSRDRPRGPANAGGDAIGNTLAAAPGDPNARGAAGARGGNRNRGGGGAAGGNRGRRQGQGRAVDITRGTSRRRFGFPSDWSNNLPKQPRERLDSVPAPLRASSWEGGAPSSDSLRRVVVTRAAPKIIERKRGRRLLTLKRDDESPSGASE